MGFVNPVGGLGVRRGWLRTCGGTGAGGSGEATPELCRRWKPAAGSTEATEDRGFHERGEAQLWPIAGQVGKKGAGIQVIVFVGDLWESRREAEEQMGKEGKGEGGFRMVGAQWGYCVCLRNNKPQQSSRDSGKSLHSCAYPS